MSLRLEIERVVGGGLGLAHDGGRTILVRGALTGETVEAEEDDARRGVVFARATEVIGAPHPARCADPCPQAALCGGCDWPHVDPAAGAPLKAEVAAEAARGHKGLAARLRAAGVQPSPPAYRLRARLHWDPARRTLGFYGHRSWRVEAIDPCRVVSPRLAAARPALTEALAATCPAAVDLEWLEDLEGTTAVAGLRPARGGPRRVDPRWLPGPDRAGDVNGFHVLASTGQIGSGWGADGVTMALPRPLEAPLDAFFQGNRHLARWLFGRLTELAGPAPVPTWDLHAGVGLLAAAALAASPRAATAVEPCRPAARAAMRNLPEAIVHVGLTAEQALARARSLPSEALVLTDPPRAGLTPELRRALLAWRPARLLLMSCDPATWARDAAAFLDAGYELGSLELVDLFPSTHHVEVLAMLERP